MERAAREADYLRHAADELEDAEAEGRRGDRARRTPHHHDAGREDRQRPARGAGGGRRSAFAGAGAGRGGAPARTPRRQFAGAGRAGGEGDRHRDQRAGRGRPASRARPCVAADFDPAELERIEERLFALRAASRKYSTPVDGLAALARQIRRRRRADRCRRGSAEEAGSRGRRGRRALTARRRRSCRQRATRPPRSSTRRSMPSWRR